MKKKILLPVFFAAVGMIPAAHATADTATDLDSQYFTITNIETHEIPTEQPLLEAPFLNQSALPDIGVSIADIVNIGKEIWTIIQDNKPVVNVSTDHASALPKGITEWTSLAGWQAPQAKTFQTTFTNAYGINVVTFEYRLTYTGGGNYRGKGKYLANVTVVPSNLYVAWGYKFTAQATIPSITNAGTTQSPLAAAEILVKWDIDTVINHIEQSADYYVRGDGTFQALQ